GGVTRNAVIGKVHRLGLSNRGPGGAEEPKAEAAPKPAPAPRAAVEQPAPPPAEEQLPAPAPAARRTPPAIRDATQPRAPGAPTPEEEAARATLAQIEKIAKRVGLLELTERVCKWPIGDPNDEDFAFCGLAAVPGQPYCPHHVA